MKRKFSHLAGLLALPLLLSACAISPSAQVNHSSGSDKWTAGFGSAVIIPEDIKNHPLYISGYNQGWLVDSYLNNGRLYVYEGILEGWGEEKMPDYAQARAVFLDAGSGGVLLIGIDCVALSTYHVEMIRQQLASIAKEKNCISVNVYATHSHALPDTLGLWGPMGIDGKDDAYMEKVVEAAVSAGTQALSELHPGQLRYGKVTTEDVLYDSRQPAVFDADLHQLRFESEDGFGVRMYFYGAHAESLRGANRKLSRDFPGVLCDLVTAETGDYTMFLPGAIGGLIMTREFTTAATINLQTTGRILADYALSITPESETVLKPDMAIARTEFTCPLDNNAFLYYQFLGILQCNAEKGDSRTGYLVRSEMSVLKLDTLAITLIPGEIFPELVYGGSYGTASSENENPTPLMEIANRFGVEDLLIIGLANDELGYIVPPSDFLINPDNPYLDRMKDKTGEDHYEETNSVGPKIAHTIAESFETLMKAVYPQ